MFFKELIQRLKFKKKIEVVNLSQCYKKKIRNRKVVHLRNLFQFCLFIIYEEKSKTRCASDRLRDYTDITIIYWQFFDFFSHKIIFFPPTIYDSFLMVF